jgi:hypothetical protein
MVPDEQLKVGDVVKACGVKRITKILPYDGPLKDIVFALAETDIGCGFSLQIGVETECLRD